MKSDKHKTALDFESLKGSFSTEGPPNCSDKIQDGSPTGKINKKVPSESRRVRKIVQGPSKSLGLPQVADSEILGSRSLILRTESPWDTFKKVFSCELAGTVMIAIHRTRPSRVLAIREYSGKDEDKMLDRFRRILHENVISAKECYRYEGSLYALVDDLPLTLEHLAGRPNESQLASIVTQVLDGVSYLSAVGFEHESLTCSNILLGLDGCVKIAALEFCVRYYPTESQAKSIKALAAIMMTLMQTYEKEDGLVGVDDVRRWPVDSDTVEFLSATSSARFIDTLKQLGLL
ncbi:uncharacterized protein ATNIH1004_011524 [Aspergillus tanneri]|uniref:Protein kinase domain-containing protein n=1 Tax=Aspergillus tanneri TaxID=1220188 RepID=A0A5M9MDH0_9EURO|nr:uncharacterized protein ATNIH1004_011524 [Aspergillus tanneri]KAA8642579.1 hypothetical protein ATNIH1004_011524 [Aspergillus tanneri]